MSRTARPHDLETRCESDAGTPRSTARCGLGRSARTASSMGAGTRATLPPVAHKGENTRTRQNRRALSKTANRRARRRPNGDRAIFLDRKPNMTRGKSAAM